MDREDVIRMAKEAGAKFDPHWGIAYNCGTETFIRFAALVAAAERERCAEAAEFVSPRHTECGNKIAAAIRAL